MRDEERTRDAKGSARESQNQEAGRGIVKANNKAKESESMDKRTKKPATNPAKNQAADSTTPVTAEATTQELYHHEQTSIEFLFQSILFLRVEKLIDDIFPGAEQEEFRAAVHCIFHDWQGLQGLIELLHTPPEILRECLPYAVAGIRMGFIKVDGLEEWLWLPREDREVNVDELMAALPDDCTIHFGDWNGGAVCKQSAKATREPTPGPSSERTDGTIVTLSGGASC